MIVRRACGALAVLTALVAGFNPPIGAATPRQSAPTIELSAQTPLAERGSTFVVRLRLTDIPDDGSITLSLRQRVRSRSEFEASISGDGLRSRVIDTVTPIATLPVLSDGTRRLVLSLDPGAGGVPLSAAGVYPLEVIAKSADEAELATLITHLIVPPEPGDTSPPLKVAVVARLGAPPSLQPDGSNVVDRAELGRIGGLVAALGAVADVPATLAITPETVEALTAGTDPADTELVDDLRQVAVGRTVLQHPYVDVSLDALVSAGLTDELTRQQQRGRQVLIDAVGQTPSDSTWIADPDLGALGLAALPSLGVEHVVVEPTQVSPLPEGLLNLSLAHRFLLAPPDTGARGPDPAPSSVDAIALDPTVVRRLAGHDSPALVASRVLTELAVIWFEQPGVPRGAVLPISPDVDPQAVQAILKGLGAGKVFAAASLNALFADTTLLVDAGDNAVARSLTAEDFAPFTSSDVDEIHAARAALEAFGGLVGANDSRTNSLERQLLSATAADVSSVRLRSHAQAVVGAVDALAAQVSGPERFTLTLTARDGTIPLTLRNDSGVPLHVVVHLRSAKLDFPEGTEIQITLADGSTRLDIPVVARASGAFRLDIDVTSPDGQRQLAMSRYTVRSTAVAGAGLLLSIGAGLFLVVWWARHWRQTRRSARLVASTTHPTTGPPPAHRAGK